MDSIIINGDEPKLLQLVVWFDGKFVNNSVVTVQIGSRAPLISKNYYPSTKIYFYVIVNRFHIPTVKIKYNDLVLPLNLSEYEEKKLELIKQEQVRTFFIYQLLNSTDKVQAKYWSSKEYDDKLTRFEGLSNFVRSQAEFLALYQRNQEIEQIKFSEQEVEKGQKEMSEEIIVIKKTSVDYKVIFVLVILFITIGYLFKVLERRNKQFWELRQDIELQQPQAKVRKNKNKSGKLKIKEEIKEIIKKVPKKTQKTSIK